MNFSEIVNRLKDAYAGSIVNVEPDAIDPWVEVAPQDWHDVARLLRNGNELAMDYLHCVTGVDYLEPDAKKATKVDWTPHVEVLYHLSSLEFRHRLVVKIQLPRWNNDAVGYLPEVPSVADIWNTANWHEREVYDLVGVRFTNHPNLNRILCPEDWIGHPLRKDYEMPLEYHGIRGR